MRTQLFIALRLFLLMTILTGIIYPLVVTGIAQAIFPHQANGSLLKEKNSIIGSELIGQSFDSTIYFHSRPSACQYNTMPASASNLSLTNDKLKQQFFERKSLFLKENNLSTTQEVPSEMLFTSASGLDPHISPESAQLQLARIISARKLNKNKQQQLVVLLANYTEPRQWAIFGEERVNVLKLNLALDQLFR